MTGETPQVSAKVIRDPEHPEAGRGGIVPPVETRFQPGNRANPGGRPKGANVVSPLLRDMAKGCVIDKETGEVLKYGDKAEEAARRFIEAALAGDKQTVEALAKLIERTDGPVRQEIDVSAEVTTKRVVLEREPPQ